MPDNVVQLTPLQTLAKQLAANQRASDRADANRRRADKNPAIIAYHQKQITAEEYEELVGETYVATQQDIYMNQVQMAQENLATRVQGGFMTAEDYEAITGLPYITEEE